MNKLDKIAAQAAGWMYAEACSLADNGQDIRDKEFSEMIDRMKRDLSSDPDPINFNNEP